MPTACDSHGWSPTGGAAATVRANARASHTERGGPPWRDDLAEHGGDADAACQAMVQRAVERMYAPSEENQFLEVTYQNGDKEVMYFKDFSSGAMIENVVRRAKKLAIKRELADGAKGIKVDDLLESIHQEFKGTINGSNQRRNIVLRIIGGKRGTQCTTDAEGCQ